MQSFQPGNRLQPMQNGVPARRNPNIAIDAMAMYYQPHLKGLGKNMVDISNKNNSNLTKTAKSKTKSFRDNMQIFNEKADSVKQEMEQIQLQEELS